MYESAIAQNASGDALLHVGRDTLFAGALSCVGLHSHAVPVFLAGLYGSFRLRIDGGAWITCRTAVVPAGIPHELNAGHMPLAVLYPDVGKADLPGLAMLVTQRIDGNRLIAGQAGETGLFRELYESGQSHAWTGEAMDDLFSGSGVRRRRNPLDVRLARVIDALHREPELGHSVDHVAAAQGFSSSRLMHLFAQQMGIPYRRYRLWCRLQSSMRQVASGKNLTMAAIEAGFSDSQHFSREFRRSLGIPPSGLLRRVGRISL